MSTGLTEEDRRKLGQLSKMDGRELAEYAGTAVDPPGTSLDPTTWDDSKPLEAPWRDGDGRRGVTLECCNAVRCAAEDGLSASRIASFYNSIGDKTTAWEHATGRCTHGEGDIEPVEMKRDVVTEKQCAQLRQRWERGEFANYREAGRWLGRQRHTAWRHVNGECGHGGGES